MIELSAFTLTLRFCLKKNRRKWSNGSRIHFCFLPWAASPSSTSKARTSRNGWPAAGFAGRSSAHWNSEHERYLTAKRSCSQFQCALTARSAVGPANDLLLVAEIF
jgi:hypothetical protein